MLPQLSLLFSILTAVYASGEFIVLHSPDSVAFTINGEIQQSSLKEILSAALGYTVKHRDSECSIAIWNPFSMPKALVAISIDGMEQLPFLNDKTKVTYPLIVDEAEETTWQAIRSRVEERSNDNTLVRINLSDGIDALGQSALGELKPANMEKLKTLSLAIEKHRKFVEEMQLLRAIADNASSAKKHNTAIYWIVLSGFDGNNTSAVGEAYKMLNDGMERVCKAFRDAYDDKIVCIVFTNDAWKLRNARSILERQRRNTLPEFSGRAKTYTENYPVIFNIMLWFGVVFIFSLLAICIAIADMDPGRDSIIYRMTSNRMKKDN